MASIEKRAKKNGEINYQVNIRRKGFEIYKTFRTEEDANLYAFYKERLIDNMDNFEIDIKNRVTLKDILEIKLNSVEDIRARQDIENSYMRVHPYIEDKFLSEISYDDWLHIAKSLLGESVYRGAKNEKNKRLMSVSTLRRYFAVMSSIFSNAANHGIRVHNHPLDVLKAYIYPEVNKAKKQKNSI